MGTGDGDGGAGRPAPAPPEDRMHRVWIPRRRLAPADGPAWAPWRRDAGPKGRPRTSSVAGPGPDDPEPEPTPHPPVPPPPVPPPPPPPDPGPPPEPAPPEIGAGSDTLKSGGPVRAP